MVGDIDESMGFASGGESLGCFETVAGGAAGGCEGEEIDEGERRGWGCG